MNLNFETKKLAEGYKYVIGCDEVGRGCLAGPVVAGAVVLSNHQHDIYKEIKDSKELTAKKRQELSVVIKKIALSWSIAEVSPKQIDEINIHNASLLAMRKAVDSVVRHCEESYTGNRSSDDAAILGSGKRLLLSDALDRNDKVFLFIDGKFIIPSFTKTTECKSNFNIEQQAVIGGDNKVLSIAAASIIAKVYRDELMQKFDKQFPGYGFTKHKGYATVVHRQAVIKKGLSPIHRLTFCKKLI
jgi:ribonuclease HII